MGDHTESIQIEFDPTRVAYADLLQIFFAEHDACAAPHGRQYMSAIFWHDERQQATATALLATIRDPQGRKPQTEVAPYRRFWLAEDYHQKYELRRAKTIEREMLAHYPRSADFIRSTAAARLNGYLGGNGSADALKRDLPRLGLSDAARIELNGALGR